MFNKQITPEFIEFCGEVWDELIRADAKHGDWRNLSYQACIGAIYNEVQESNLAVLNNDVHSPHGIKAESVQVAVTAFKLFRKASTFTELFQGKEI